MFHLRLLAMPRAILEVIHDATSSAQPWDERPIAVGGEHGQTRDERLASDSHVMTSDRFGHEAAW